MKISNNIKFNTIEAEQPNHHIKISNVHKFNPVLLSQQKNESSVQNMRILGISPMKAKSGANILNKDIFQVKSANEGIYFRNDRGKKA